MMELPLAGQVALVTGGAKRIGRAIARRLAADGADIVINYASSHSEAAQLASELKGSGRRAIPLRADVSRSAEVRAMFEAVAKEFGRLDILVNNAAIFFPAEFESITEEQWDRIMDINLKGSFLCAQAAVPLLRKSGHGLIVNLSSLGAFLSWPSYTHYCTSKAGVVMLTRCMARALAPGIRVNSVAPGVIEFPEHPAPESMIRQTPLGRTGTAEDIANAVAYLVSADFVTGQTLIVDGGRVLT
jgi:NAD(P)-dependent dehydrogenase (short-subunit alcohol dehydrogenase family)